MPKRQPTVEEKILQNINNRFVKLDRDNTEITDNERGADLNYGLFDQDTNLGYYRENGASGKAEIEEFNKLQFEEKYRGDLLDKYRDYQEKFSSFRDEYRNYSKLQSLKVELDNAKLFQEQLIENAKKNNETLSLDPISTEVEGLEAAKNNFNRLYKEVLDMSNEIHNLEKEETFKKMLDEHMAKLKENEPVPEEKVEEAKPLEKEEIEQAPVEEVKENPTKSDSDIEKEINELEYYATLDDIEPNYQNSINKYFNNYVGEEKLQSQEKYPCYGFGNDVTLNEAVDAYKKDKLESLKESLKYQQNHIKEEDNYQAERGFNKAVNAVNDCVDEKLSIRERDGMFYDVLSYYSNEIRYDSSDRNKISKVSEIAGIANRLAQIHSTSPKPGFFSRLFNTKYNKLYKSEESSIEFYKDILKGSCKLDSDYIDKITNRDTCKDGINQEEFMNKFYEGMKTYSPDNILFKNPDSLTKVCDNIAKIEMVKAAFNKKNPIDMVSNYFKEKDDKAKAKENESKLENAREAEVSESLEGAELDNTRVQIEIKECAPEKQGLDLNNQEVDNELSLSQNGPEMSSN